MYVFSPNACVYPIVNFNHEVTFPFTTIAVIEKLILEFNNSLMNRGSLFKNWHVVSCHICMCAGEKMFLKCVYQYMFCVFVVTTTAIW